MDASKTAGSTRHTRLLVVLLIAVGTAIFIGANVHLVYVAFTSQPDCVDHVKPGEPRPGQYSAAKSSC